jgi:hypothetical protein
MREVEATARQRGVPVYSKERGNGSEHTVHMPWRDRPSRRPVLELQPLDAEYEPQPCVKCAHFGRYGSKGEAEGINHGRVVYRCTRCRVLFFSPRQYVRPGVENGL